MNKKRPQTLFALIATVVIISITMVVYLQKQPLLPEQQLSSFTSDYENGRYESAFSNLKQTKDSENLVKTKDLGRFFLALYRERKLSPRLIVRAMDYNAESRTRKDFELIYKNYPRESPVAVTFVKDSNGQWVVNLIQLSSNLKSIRNGLETFERAKCLATAMRQSGLKRLYTDRSRYTTPERLEAYANRKIEHSRVYTRDHEANPI